jgi:hypothetical protein
MNLQELLDWSVVLPTAPYVSNRQRLALPPDTGNTRPGGVACTEGVVHIFALGYVELGQDVLPNFESIESLDLAGSALVGLTL